MSPSGPRGLEDARGFDVVDRSGSSVGELVQLYVAPDGGRPRWLEVAGGLHGMARYLVPACAARVADVRVDLDLDAGLVRLSPTLDPGDGLSAREERALFTHYGIDPAEGDEKGDENVTTE